MGLHFQSFAGMGRPDAVNEFGERFFFVGFSHGLVRVIESWVR